MINYRLDFTIPYEREDSRVESKKPARREPDI
ncbi:hypothetical protein PDE_00997 [Penicillium oxalicum 114-2]|uniref:Uncharacterized protein n=1 Tax=Penicillium oxalicum (strain 114-2 / CGMCC 5302) TaxID=933388 RepID=S7ZBJ5_PENO1|nr:hypothetical protein PDE_00997 [Penicillium oxalicum 114-2]